MTEVSDGERLILVFSGLMMSGTGVVFLTLGVLFLLRAVGVIE